MREPSSKRARTLTVATARVLVLCLPLSLSACHGAAGHLRPAERLELERRATDLLLRAAQSEDPELACNALEALAEVAPDEGLPYFHAALRSEHPLVRFAGLTALGTLRDRQSRSLVQTYLDDPSPLVRLAAAFAAYRGGDSQRAAVLVNALTDHPDENVRAEAAHLIGLLEEPQALKRLRHAASLKANERSHKVLVQIYTAMARLDNSAAVRRLVELAQGAPATRLMALQGLAEVADEQARDALLYRMSPAEDYVMHRLIAARGLAGLGSDAGYKLAMANTAYVGSNPDDPAETMRVRANAALVLGEIGDPRALGVLKRMAEEPQDARVQVAACYAVCRIVRR